MSTESISIAPMRIEGFYGENQDINDWLNKFEAMAILYKWSDSMKVTQLGIYLGGIARKWFANLSNEEKNDYAAVKANLKKAFGMIKKQDTHEEAVRMEKQESEELMTVSAMDIQDLHKEIDLNVNEKEKIYHLIKRLKDNMVIDESNMVDT